MHARTSLLAVCLLGCGAEPARKPVEKPSVIASAAPPVVAAPPARPRLDPAVAGVSLLPFPVLPACGGIRRGSLLELDAKGEILVTTVGDECWGVNGGGLVRLWDVKTGALRANLPAMPEAVQDFSLSSSGELLAVAFRDSMQVYDLVTLKKKAEIKIPNPRESFDIWFVRGSTSLVMWWQGLASKIVDIEAKTVRDVWGSSSSLGSSSTFQRPITTKDGRHLWGLLISTSEGDKKVTRVAVMDLDRVEEVHTIPLVETETLGLPQMAVLNEAGSQVAVGYRGGAIEVWDLATIQKKVKLDAHVGAGDTSGLRWLAWSADGKTLVSWGYDKFVRGWDVATAAKRWERKGVDSAIGITFTGSQRLVYCDESGAVSWDPATSREERFPTPSIGNKNNGLLQCATSASGNAFAWSTQRNVAMWTVPEKQLVGNGEEAWASVWFSQWTADGTRFVLGTSAGLIVLDAESGRVLWSRAKLGSNPKIVLSKDGAAIALMAGDAPTKVRLLSVATGDVTAEIEPPNAPDGILDIALSPDGKQLATTGQEIAIWDVATGKSLGTLKSKSAVFERAAFFPNNGTILAFSARNIPPSGYMPMNGNECFIESWNPASKSRKVLSSERVGGMACFPLPPVFDPTGDHFIFEQGDSGKFIVYDIARDVANPPVMTDATDDIAFRPDGLAVGLLQHNGIVALRAPDTLKSLLQLAPPAMHTWSFGWAPKGETLVMGHLGGAYLWRRRDKAAAWIGIWASKGAQPAVAITTPDGRSTGDAEALKHLRYRVGSDALRGDIISAAELGEKWRDSKILDSFRHEP